MSGRNFATWCAACALTYLAACGFEGTGASPTETGTDGVRCGFEYLNVCALTAGPDRTYTQSLTLDTSNPQTCTHLLPQADGPEVCVIYAPAITLSAGATLRALGSRPLALVSRGDIIINGTLSVGSRSQGGTQEQLGAGALSGVCPSFAQAPAASAQGGGGAAGAAFRGGGGAGGRGDGVHPGGNASPPLATAPRILRGGCRGQAGGDGAQALSGGTGGPPGGALLLAAHSAIRLAGASARVAAGGGAGRGGRLYGGGGGAGSGGMIVFEAAQIVNEGAVRANGGGGGQGSFDFLGNSASGTDGQDSGDNTMLADGAGESGFACSGGDGSNGATTEGRPARDGFASTAGPGGAGGGGGGGAGFVVVRGVRSGAGTYSPAAQ